MSRFVNKLARDQRGASVIEMALVTPILASLLVGIVDISRAYSEKLQLEQAAQRAIEKVQQYQADSNTYDTLKNEAVSAATDAGFNVTADDVAIDFWLECDGTRQADYDTTCSSGQAYARWVTVAITGSYTPMFSSSKWPGANSDGSYTIHAQAGLRTQ